MKEHPLEVVPITEFEGGPDPLWYISKGHHPIDAFVLALKTIGVDASPAFCSHTYWRFQPSGDIGAFVPCQPGRGAFPCTVYDLEADTDAYIRQYQRQREPRRVRLVDLLKEPTP